MTFRFNAKHLVLCLSLSAFFSCKKDDSPTPPPAEPTLFEQVQGRWNAEIEAPPRHSNVSAKGQDMAHVAAIEFFSDSSYVIAFSNDYDNNAITGKITIVDSASINLSGEDITSIGDLKISEDSISFTYTMYDHLVTVKAAKAENLTINTDKKPLLKSWKIERGQEDGEYLFQQEQLGEDAEITFFFSAAGSFMFHIVDGDNESTRFLNWKWHPEVANAAKIYSFYGEMYSGNYFRIVSLTNTTLTIEEVFTQSGSQMDPRTYVLTAL